MVRKTSKKSKKPDHAKPNFLEGEFSLPQLEEQVLKFWDDRGIFEKSVAENKAKGKSKSAKKNFVFYEGPPTANGRPGVHHVLARAFKDIIPRYKTMQGFYVPRKGGWDTHGLPVELQVEKQLGLKSKKEIEQYGIAAFNEKCRASVWEFKDEWERFTKRMGFWIDLKNPYITYEPEYMDTLWWIIGEFWKKKALYKGHRVVPWCTRCGTSLSSHELAQGYKEVTDNSVYVKFKLKPGQKIGNFTTDDKTYILSWTTTPWTLPGNVALAAGADIDYVIVKTWTGWNEAGRNSFEHRILAKDIYKSLHPEKSDGTPDWLGLSFWNIEKSSQPLREGYDIPVGPTIAAEIKGSKLIGFTYESLFDVKALQSEKSYRIYPADFVTTTDGTGVVHTAVMYGEDDYVLGKKLGLPEHHTVDEAGKFTKDVLGLEGRYVKSKETEEAIFEHLRAHGNLLKIEPYKHEYPHCWRCATPILYYARTSWFVGMSKLRHQLLDSNKTINWIPEYFREGRFGEWLKEAKDWNFSRERYWGTPLPIWECKQCKHTEVAGGIDALNALAGSSKNNYWVMRHGEAENNLFDIIDSGQSKFLHLTPRGRKQVEASIKKFKHELARRGEKIDFMIASDIVRTRETEEIDAEILTGGKISVDKRIEEIRLGPTFNGYRDEKYADYFPTYAARFEKRPEGGESLRDLRARMWQFLEDCESKYQGKNILLVTHDYPAWMLFHASAGWSEKRAIAEKEALGDNFLDFAEIRKLDVKMISRNDTGEIDLHKPYIDRIVLPCEKCGSKMHRVPEVADVWFDSGSMPFAQAHWPFEQNLKSHNQSPKPPTAFPADYISEAVDQTRGWFYTLLAVATALGYKAPYKNVICLGHINDKNGQKMSKSKGNIVDPWATMGTYGVDAVRWYFYTATPPGEPKNFDEAELGKTVRKVHLIVYNSFVFWKTYAKQNPKAKLENPKSKNVLDQWILVRLDEVVLSTTKKLDRYEIREAALEIESFIDDLSRWYIRRSRRRLQRPESAKDYESASTTLGWTLLSLIKLMAPFTPFFSEGLYTALGGEKESVHLDAWPTVSSKTQNAESKKIVAQMKSVRELAALGLAKRAEAGIKVRQPLTSMTIGIKLHEDLQKILADEVNVKNIISSAKLKDGVELDVVITPELREEGLVREVARMVQELRQKAGLLPKDRVVLMTRVGEELRAALMKNEAVLKADVGAKSIEYKQSEKFSAEIAAKIEGQEVWVGIRKI